MRTLPERAAESVGAGDNVLLLCPSFGEPPEAACADLLTVADPSRTGVFVVTFTDSPGDRLDAWDRQVDAEPAETAFVSVEAATRSGETADPPGEFDGVDVTVDCVSSPENLTRLGVQVTECFDGWTADLDGEQVVACFDSASALLQYASPQEAFEFLDVLTDRFREAGAVAHYHMEPRAHDDETVERFRTLFDVVCAFDEGHWRVRTG